MNVFLYILVMALVTYLIRMLPLTLIRGRIKNQFVKSFLYYVPYACLMSMTFPAVFYAAENVIAAVAGVVVATLLALRGKGLVTVAIAASVVTYASSWLLQFISL